MFKEIRQKQEWVLGQVKDFRTAFESLQGLRLDTIREELLRHSDKIKKQSDYIEGYCGTVQDRFDEMEKSFRVYTADLIQDQEGLKQLTREYISDFFDQQQKEQKNLSQLCVALKESVLIEHGIASAMLRLDKEKIENEGLAIYQQQNQYNHLMHMTNPDTFNFILQSQIGEKSQQTF